MFTKAFLKDAFERFGSTFIAVLIGTFVGIYSTKDFDWDKLGEKSFWIPILVTSAVTAAKAVLAYLKNPNTGASLGTTVPGELVSAYTTQTTVTRSEADGYRGGAVLAHPGDTVAGPAAPAAIDEGLKVEVARPTDYRPPSVPPPSAG